LERLAEMAIANGTPEKAVRLLSAAAALRISIGSVIDPVDHSEYQNKLATLRTELGASRFGKLWDEGNMLTPEQAIALAFEE
jgi:hypothetical protein